MFSEIVKNINWVDILVICIILRIVHIGSQRGFVIELFKCVGVLCTIFITYHYYSFIAKFLESNFSLFRATAEVLSFGLLWGGGSLIFKLIRDGILLMFKIEAHAVVDKWGGLVIGFLRSVLIASVFLVFLQILDVEYVSKNVKKSFLNAYLFDISPKVYRTCYEEIVEKFFPSEKLNLSVFELKTVDLKDSSKN